MTTAPAEETTTTDALPEGRYACADCGQACPEGAAVCERVPVFVQRHRADPGHHAGYMLLSRCPSCAPRAASAARLLKALGSYRRDGLILHGPALRDHLVSALCGLEAAGGTTAPPDDPRELLSAFEAVPEGLASARSARWASVASVHPGRCAPAPWAHVPEETRGALRVVAGRLMAVRMAAGAPPVDLAPPSGGGCAMCGLASISVSAAEVARLGGTEAACASAWSAGSLCHPCADAVEQTGARGPTAVERAYLASGYARGAGLRRRIEAGELTVRPWSGSGAASSATPWAHMAAEVARLDEAGREHLRDPFESWVRAE
ncbi:hypothetical protein [Spirillospora sp. NPDC048819]|uniref:hypothetical protein n=1 Tax=Spirillospora sp. NPDC048819 TaxID=3155268 RepID=UPI0033C6CF65